MAILAEWGVILCTLRWGTWGGGGQTQMVAKDGSGCRADGLIDRIGPSDKSPVSGPYMNGNLWEVGFGGVQENPKNWGILFGLQRFVSPARRSEITHQVPNRRIPRGAVAPPALVAA